jgi:PTH1 family peptidyl-tRNA hydrolase
MTEQIKLIAGLGNPDIKYLNTRHNFGFKALDAVADKQDGQWKNWKDMASVVFYNRGNKKVLLVKPMTYMNNSGYPLRAVADFYKIKPAEILVIYDDFSIPLGGLKFRLNGSSGGHNGIKSIIENLGDDKFPRIKLGIGPLPKYVNMPDFVLSKFSNEDMLKVDNILTSIIDIINMIIDLGFEKAVSKIKL